MEGYAAGKPAASADAGLAVLVSELTGLVGELAGAGPAVMSFDEVEQLVMVRGRELLRKVIQHVMDAGAAAEPRLPGVADAAGVPRPRAERGHARAMISQVGPVVVERVAYRAPGQPNLYPRDAVLNLPPRRYSWCLQRAVVEYVLAGAYEQARRFVAAATGITIGKQQLEQITIEAAADAPGFYPALARDQGQGGEGPGRPAGPLLISADCKGVAMLPGALRRRGARAPAQRVRNFEKRRGTGEKGLKRMAQLGCVFDAEPAPRTPEQVMASKARAPGSKDPPRALRRWYTVGIATDRAGTIRAVFDEAGRRDPRHERTWVALVDGDNHQIEMIRAQAAARGIDLVILIDFIHVLEYLWKAAWCFHPPRDPAIEAWVTAQGLGILHGRAAQVTQTIRQLAAARPPRPGGEHAKIIRKTLTYLDAKQPYLDYPRALAEGWPIATGVIEGACRHLVQDRMGITGARWGLEGAQAILWLRAIRANGDLDTYWTWHLQQELHRNHLSRYQNGLQLAA
jgi:hypothetical protein